MATDAARLPLLGLYSAGAIAVSGIGARTSLPCWARPACWWARCPMSRGSCRRPVPPPPEALPGFCRFLAEFEPLRQIPGGIRSIHYYGAQDDAGLAPGWVMIAVGLVAAALFGFGGTGWCDRRGLHRILTEANPEETAVPA
ncbi:hypothetical protein ACFZDK_42790 [Streptomyces sp. NPDC007901]|uniref:hypothetical protein n=1 Tax=Streptomyces sp. NPDC007901 TaxID=3364785 RepID=UPI0036EA71A8